MDWRLPALLAGALALRLAIAPLPSYWVDEAFTVQLLGQSLGGTLSGLADSESTPPLYYALAWLWTQATGLGELGLRSLSAVAGAATAGLAWGIGRWIAGPRAALAAGALTAASPFLIWFSTEARAYALATALTTGALLAVVRLLGPSADRAGSGDADRGAERHLGDADDSGARRRLATWAVLAAGALATHYATAFVVGAQAVILLRRRGSRAAWAAVAAVAAAGAALIPLAVAQRGNDHAQQLDDMAGPLAERIAQLPKQFAIGFDAPLEIATGAAAIAILLIGVALVLLPRRDRDTPPSALRERALVPLTVGAAGVVAPVAVSLVGLDVVSSRYLLPALPPLLAVAGAGLAAGPWRRLGPALAAGLVAAWLAVAIAVAADVRLQTRPDWQGAERSLGPVPAGGRAIVATPASGALVLTDGYRLPARYDPPRPVSEVVLAATAAPGDPPPATSPSSALSEAGFELTGERRERGYVLQRWRAASPTALDPTTLTESSLDPTGSAILWQPP